MKEKKENEIRHEGKVLEKGQEYLKVEILAKSACAGCHARSVCGTSSGDSRIILVKRYDDGRFNVGDEVDVVVKESLGFKAVFIAYLLPLSLLILLLLTLPWLIPNELVSGLMTVGFIGLYYLALSFFKDRLGNEFVFTVEKTR